MKTAIIGGGAAGFFCAINLAEMMPKADITIFERQARPLRKVEISGGGRCNCTNTFEGVTDLQHVYPRGARLMGRLFRQFSPQDAYRWFESHGVPLTVQPDHCVFPAAQDSHAIIDCFMRETHRHNIRLITNHRIDNPTQLLSQGFDHVVVTTGGQPRMGVPSLFTLR
ncbi:MAG: NAD(P)/FAD-dependent oxidoreductase, partial [Prevotella sp.]|nr:NAD(P)/FAD-dependent oxidoreductase [Prevotella sp.]